MTRPLSGPQHYRWKGGKTIQGGYAVTKIHGHKRANRHGYVKDHILLAESVYGGPLPVGASVHHVNGDKLDNRKENIVICQSESYHQILHRRERSLRACGDANYRICKYCKKYDDVANMSVASDGLQIYHKKCASARMAVLRKETNHVQ